MGKLDWEREAQRKRIAERGFERADVELVPRFERKSRTGPVLPSASMRSARRFAVALVAGTAQGRAFARQKAIARIEALRDSDPCVACSQEAISGTALRFYAELLAWMRGVRRVQATPPTFPTKAQPAASGAEAVLPPRQDGVGDPEETSVPFRRSCNYSLFEVADALAIECPSATRRDVQARVRAFGIDSGKGRARTIPGVVALAVFYDLRGRPVAVADARRRR